jgi:ABC-2 type transport system ATP-binding protein
VLIRAHEIPNNGPQSFQVLPGPSKATRRSGLPKGVFRAKVRNGARRDDLSFEIGEGEIVGFLGPNGAGKTTALKVLSGLLFPTAGEVSVCGFRPFDRKPEFLRQITLTGGTGQQFC